MNTRERILKAAKKLMQTKGLTGTTTKEIAQAAGVSEGSLYNHFKNRSDLFLCILRELPNDFADFVGLMRELRGRAGQGSVQGTLQEVAAMALVFYKESIPMGASFFSEPGLLDLHRENLREQNAGPHKTNMALAGYLRAEQALGRIRRDADPDAAAYLLLGACFQHAYWTQFLGEAQGPTAERFVNDLLTTLMAGLKPAG